MAEPKPWYKYDWWYAILYALFVLANHFFGLGVDVGSLIALVIPLIAVIFGDRWIESKKLDIKILELELKILEKEAA